MIAEIAFGLFGLSVLIGIAMALSSRRRDIDWRLVLSGITLQIIFAIIVIIMPGGREFFEYFARFFVRIVGFALEGSRFIFGDLASLENFGFVFAFQVLPTIIFFAALMSVLYLLGIMQKIVQGMAWIMLKVLRTSGSESLSAAANIFVGQTEAPLVVRPYISSMTESELFTMMVAGMATIAGAVLAAYVAMLGGGDEAQQLFYARHLLAASVMAAPATIVIAKLLKPEFEPSLTKGVVKLEVERTAGNVIEAAANGASDGVRLALNVGGMLLAFVALIAMIDFPLTWLGQVLGIENLIGQPLGLAVILGYLLAPVAWVIGVPWIDAVAVGGLIGQKIVTNEFVAYVQLNQIKDSLSPHSVLIATYALCGFANFSSIAIQLAGIGGLAPERKPDLARLGLLAVLGGTLATMMTATIAGVLTSIAT